MATLTLGVAFMFPRSILPIRVLKRGRICPILGSNRTGNSGTTNLLLGDGECCMKARPVKDRRMIVFVTFETEFAKSGGLCAVMGILPGHMAQRAQCLAIGPYFQRITDLENIQEDKRLQEYCPLPSFSFSTEKKV